MDEERAGIGLTYQMNDINANREQEDHERYTRILDQLSYNLNYDPEFTWTLEEMRTIAIFYFGWMSCYIFENVTEFEENWPQILENNDMKKNVLQNVFCINRSESKVSDELLEKFNLMDSKIYDFNGKNRFEDIIYLLDSINSRMEDQNININAQDNSYLKENILEKCAEYLYLHNIIRKKVFFLEKALENMPKVCDYKTAIVHLFFLETFALQDLRLKGYVSQYQYHSNIKYYAEYVCVLLQHIGLDLNLWERIKKLRRSLLHNEDRHVFVLKDIQELLKLDIISFVNHVSTWCGGRCYTKYCIEKFPVLNVQIPKYTTTTNTEQSIINFYKNAFLIIESDTSVDICKFIFDIMLNLHVYDENDCNPFKQLRNKCVHEFYKHCSVTNLMNSIREAVKISTNNIAMYFCSYNLNNVIINHTDLNQLNTVLRSKFLEMQDDSRVISSVTLESLWMNNSFLDYFINMSKTKIDRMLQILPLKTNIEYMAPFYLKLLHAVLKNPRPILNIKKETVEHIIGLCIEHNELRSSINFLMQTDNYQFKKILREDVTNIRHVNSKTEMCSIINGIYKNNERKLETIYIELIKEDAVNAHDILFCLLSEGLDLDINQIAMFGLKVANILYDQKEYQLILHLMNSDKLRRIFKNPNLDYDLIKQIEALRIEVLPKLSNENKMGKLSRANRPRGC